MSKIICDVCGTAYPETASQCPICGTARPDDVQSIVSDAAGTEQPSTSAYTYVKGGRFSKANVRKRNKANQTSQPRRQEYLPEEDEEEPEEPEDREDRRRNSGGNRGLVITAIILLLAVAAALVYIYLRFFAPQPVVPNPGNTAGQSTAGSTQSSEATSAPTESQPTEPPSYPCTSLTLAETVIEMDEEGSAYLLNVTVQPEETTDPVTFETSDPSVATVSPEGKVTAVAPGQAVITVRCGSFTQECKVVCIFGEPTSEPTTLPEVELRLNREDFTLAYVGDHWQLYSGELDRSAITWSSDNENVATVVNGLVTAVGSGTTHVWAEYNGQRVSCIVRCNF